MSNDNSHKFLVKRGLFDDIAHFPFLASSSSAHGSSSSSAHGSSSDHDYELNDFHHESIPDYHSHSHSHVVHHPELVGHHEDFSHDHNVAISYQNQYFGYGDHDDHEFPAASYQHQHLSDNHLSTHEDDFNKYGSESLLEFSHLDAPEYDGEYKNYGGNLEEYSQHAGLLDVSNDHKIDRLLDPFSPSHSSYDSY